MGLANFWEYVIENGWQLSYFPEDDEGNCVCPFCNTTIVRKAKLDEVPAYEKIVRSPRCGAVEGETESEVTVAEKTGE